MAKRLDDSSVDMSRSIAKSPSKLLSKAKKRLTVGDLETQLLKLYPKEDAESWDRTGLYIGERDLPVNMVAIALDPTIDAIDDASKAGADVLITHHPMYLQAPDTFFPESSSALSSGAGVWAAIRNRIAVMSFHTALDVSKQAQVILPAMLELEYRNKVVCQIPTSKSKGYGQLCKVPKMDNQIVNLGQLSARCLSVFGKAPRVWGDLEMPIQTCVTCTGSVGDVGRASLRLESDCLICGEIKYHEALELSSAGMGIIELGHDVSESPLTAILAKNAYDMGIDKNKILVIDQSDNWIYPESIRL